MGSWTIDPKLPQFAGYHLTDEDWFKISRLGWIWVDTRSGAISEYSLRYLEEVWMMP